MADEVRVFGADPDNLTGVEKRITELKTNLLKLADKRREKSKSHKLYSLPDGDGSDVDAENETRKDRLYNKLHKRYDDENRGGPPEMTEEERFWEQKEKDAKFSVSKQEKKE